MLSNKERYFWGECLTGTTQSSKYSPIECLNLFPIEYRELSLSKNFYQLLSGRFEWFL